MKFIDEYRDPEAVASCVREIKGITTRPWAIMEVCGGQTHAILKYGLDDLLPDGITLLHGPGCPVCVTPAATIDKAIDLASRKDVILCSFGDMLRVPGSVGDLMSARAAGGQVQVLYSPLDALEVAAGNRSKQVVFLAIGFETTAPVISATAVRAHRERLPNFSFLAAQVLIPPAVSALLSDPACAIGGLLAPGHVCTVRGYEEYEPLSDRFGVPIVVTGFEPLDILQGIHAAVMQLEEGHNRVDNCYTRAVERSGNLKARELMREVFTKVNREWRGLGEIPASGLALREEYAEFDAEKRFDLAPHTAREDTSCLSGAVLRGQIKPTDCPEFGEACNPEHPLGATMVSSEGACAAYYRYRRKTCATRNNATTKGAK